MRITAPIVCQCVTLHLNHASDSHLTPLVRGHTLAIAFVRHKQIGFYLMADTRQPRQEWLAQSVLGRFTCLGAFLFIARAASGRRRVSNRRISHDRDRGHRT